MWPDLSWEAPFLEVEIAVQRGLGAALIGSRVINRGIKYLLSTYYVVGVILRHGKQQRVKQRPLGPPCAGTWEPGSSSLYLRPRPRRGSNLSN